ncbi:hypothetical protein CCAND95_720006 [Capnocytophaga canis]|uniref:Uncharacterized protein n=1 Tax=Capnocytophaga canis TaxID=1848903 RepID=A0A0B7IAK4_9FLAO|nr:hypothetical protein [Capnocytophaga canis]CEN46547.1 hypothetical protein CCAND95_720006 [Capnocytophaga canis]CEN48765.1 hypothetical protein CCAND38_650003 [Capnocytophaga canis]
MITDTKMRVNFSPVLNRNSRDYSVENLQGIKFNIVISGDTIAPYQGVDIRLSPIRMTVNGQEIKPTQFQTPQFIQGGSVPSIPFEMFVDSTYLKGIANTTRKMVIEFEGIYVDRNGNTIMCDPVANILPNKVNLKVEIPIHQF